MSVCGCVCVQCMCMSLCVCVCQRMYLYVGIQYVCPCMCMYTSSASGMWWYVCVYACMYACMYVCLHVCMPACMCAYTFIHSGKYCDRTHVSICLCCVSSLNFPLEMSKTSQTVPRKSYKISVSLCASLGDASELSDRNSVDSAEVREASPVPCHMKGQVPSGFQSSNGRGKRQKIHSLDSLDSQR